MKKMNKKGFTLAELLIVVAIIAVLVAIAIPVFTSQLENSREATDAANIRSAYAEVVAAGLADPAATFTKTVTLKQQDKTKWNNTSLAAETIAGITISSITPADTIDVVYTGSTSGGDAAVTIGGVAVPASAPTKS